MKTAMFVDERARARIETWFHTFQSALPFSAEPRVVPTPVGDTHVLVAGPPDAPPLVCLHGALASSAHLLPELGPLVGRYRVHAVDVIGQSVMSADTRVPFDAYGSWLAAVLDGLGLRRAALLGVSWGGFAALRAAQFAPERIGALVLVVPAGVVSGSSWAGFVELGWPMLLYRLAPSEARLRRVFDALFSTPDPRWAAYFGDALRSYRLDMRVPPLVRPEELAGYRGPALVLGAEADLTFPGTKLVARAKELLPQAEVVLLEGAKHSPPTDESFREANAARIDAFLGRALGNRAA